MSQNKHTISTGTTSLQIVFIVLKLCKLITWSWWWVMSPTWISIGIVVIILLPLLIYKIKATKKRLAKKAMNEHKNIEIKKEPFPDKAWLNQKIKELKVRK